MATSSNKILCNTITPRSIVNYQFRTHAADRFHTAHAASPKPPLHVTSPQFYPRQLPIARTITSQNTHGLFLRRVMMK